MPNSSNNTVDKKIHFRKSGAGFTLIELLISIAITGILAAIMFNNFSQEKNRNALKGAVRRLQTDIQSAQTNAQGGVLYNNNPALAYGVWVSTSNFFNTFHTKFVDTSSGTNNLTQTSYSTDSSVQIYRIMGKVGVAAPVSYTRVDIKNAVPSGTSTLSGSPGAVALDSVTISLRSTKLSLCYAITVTARVGTVSQRQLTSCT